MKDKPIWSQATSKPPSVLVDFCNVFSETWTDEKIVEWIDAEKGSSTSEEFVAKLKQLESSLEVLIGIVDAANQYIRSFTVRPSDDSDYWSLDYLKCITHDLLDILLRIKNNLDVLLGEASSEPEQERERAYRGIIRYLKEGNLLVEKAFPLLKVQKSYLDIDWPSEFDKLDTLNEDVVEKLPELPPGSTLEKKWSVGIDAPLYEHGRWLWMEFETMFGHYSLWFS